MTKRAADGPVACARPGCGHALSSHHRVGGLIDPCGKCNCVDYLLHWPNPAPSVVIDRRIVANATAHLAELQLEAIRGVLEEVLSSSGSAHPGTWGLWLLGEIGRILDMTESAEVMAVLAEQEARRAKET